MSSTDRGRREAAVDRGGVDDRLEAGSHLAVRLRRPVELAPGEAQAAHHREDLPRPVVEREQRAVHQRLLLQGDGGRAGLSSMAITRTSTRSPGSRSPSRPSAGSRRSSSRPRSACQAPMRTRTAPAATALRGARVGGSARPWCGRARAGVHDERRHHLADRERRDPSARAGTARARAPRPGRCAAASGTRAACRVGAGRGPGPRWRPAGDRGRGRCTRTARFS